MPEFHSWISFLRDHASDPDYCRDVDSTEGRKHYIDLDNYTEFVSEGNISPSFERSIKLHGQDFVYGNGVLPWANKAAFDSLKACLQRDDLWNVRCFCC